MKTHKPSRAAGMAGTYADILTKAGVIKPQHREITPVPTLHNQIIRGEVNWWKICIGQLLTAKK